MSQPDPNPLVVVIEIPMESEQEEPAAEPAEEKSEATQVITAIGGAVATVAGKVLYTVIDILKPSEDPPAEENEEGQ